MPRLRRAGRIAERCGYGIPLVRGVRRGQEVRVLVLTRKVGQGVVIGNSIRLIVVELSGGTVRLGFEAPPEVSIYRDEIYAEIAKANQAALDVAAPEPLKGSGDDES